MQAVDPTEGRDVEAEVPAVDTVASAGDAFAVVFAVLLAFAVLLVFAVLLLAEVAFLLVDVLAEAEAREVEDEVPGLVADAELEAIARARDCP
jgi:hypothetical protein